MQSCNKPILIVLELFILSASKIFWRRLWCSNVLSAGYLLCATMYQLRACSAT